MLSASGVKAKAQIEDFSEGILEIGWVAPALEAHETESWTLAASDKEPCAKVTCTQEEGDVLSLKSKGVEVGQYQYGHKWARPFLYTILGPKRLRVTRGYPAVEGIPDEDHDHPHHKSIWVAHGDVNGADNWSEGKGHATQKHVSFSKIVSGPVYCGFLANNDWLANDGTRLLGESREVLLYETVREERILDFAVTFTATEGDVKFGDTKEGGLLSVRVRGSMNGSREGLITNACGAVTEAENWGHRASWCDYSGPADGMVAGIAIFDHEDNPLYPTYWHVRDYGLMTANPFALSYYKNDKSLDGSWMLQSGVSATFRYRVLIHLGDTDGGQVAAKYHDFINPPKVQVERKD